MNTVISPRAFTSATATANLPLPPKTAPYLPDSIRDWWLYGYLSLQVQSSPARFYWPIEDWIPRVPEGSILPLPESDSISRTVVRRWDRTAGGLNSGFRLPVGWRFSRIIFKGMRTERS